MTTKLQSSRGVCIIAYGAKAEQASRECKASILASNSLPVTIQSETEFKSPEWYTNAQKARWAKVNLYEWSPYEFTCYLDADTLAHGSLDAGYRAVEAGWDIALTSSRQQGEDWLWHVGEEERGYTHTELGLRSLQLQCGVFWFRRSDQVRSLFGQWGSQWLRYQGEDQAAFLRALYSSPARVWLLGYPFNGGAVVGHKWGLVRRT